MGGNIQNAFLPSAPATVLAIQNGAPDQRRGNRLEAVQARGQEGLVAPLLQMLGVAQGGFGVLRSAIRQIWLKRS